MPASIEDFLRGVPPRYRDEIAAYLANRVPVTIYRQREAEPEVPPWAVCVAGAEYWLECFASRAKAIAFARMASLPYSVTQTGSGACRTAEEVL